MTVALVETSFQSLGHDSNDAMTATKMLTLIDWKHADDASMHRVARARKAQLVVY